MSKEVLSDTEFFLSSVEKTETCWLWTGAIDLRLGYGSGRGDKAHRLSWRLHRGGIPPNLFVLHHCDNRRCVNPDHLWLGTQKDNQQDAIKKGRSSRGERNGRAILTADQVKSMRSSYSGKRGEMAAIARHHGVTIQTIYRVITRKNWDWLK